MVIRLLLLLLLLMRLETKQTTLTGRTLPPVSNAVSITEMNSENFNFVSFWCTHLIMLKLLRQLVVHKGTRSHLSGIMLWCGKERKTGLLRSRANVRDLFSHMQINMQYVHNHRWYVTDKETDTWTGLVGQVKWAYLISFHSFLCHFGFLSINAYTVCHGQLACV